MDEDDVFMGCGCLAIAGFIGGTIWLMSLPKPEKPISSSTKTSVEEIVDTTFTYAEEKSTEDSTITITKKIPNYEPTPYQMMNGVKVYSDKKHLPGVRLLDVTMGNILLDFGEEGALFPYQIPSFETPNKDVHLVSRATIPLIRGKLYDVSYHEFVEPGKISHKEFFKLINPTSYEPYVNDIRNLPKDVVGVIESIEQVVSYKEVNQ